MRKISDIKTVEIYNPKIDERFIRYISPHTPFTYEEVRDNESNYNILLKKFYEIKSTDLTVDHVGQLYQILDHHRQIDISEENINELNNMKTIEMMIKGFIKIIQEKIYFER